MLRKIRHNVKGHFHRPGSSQPTSALAQKAEGHNALPTTSATAATTGLPTTTSGSTAIEHIAAQPANPGPKAAVPTDKTEKRSAWPALSSLVGALDEGASAFGPIKSVVDGISRCIDIYEKNAKDREDYRILRGKLESLFSDLSEYCRGPVPLEMTTSIENLAKGIEHEIDFLSRKEHRYRIEGYTAAMKDIDEVLECYQRIQLLLERLILNSNLTLWRIVDQETAESRLNRISPSRAAWFSSAESTALRRGPCAPDTRTEVLQQLRLWTEDQSTENIYWLDGMAGTGKTTIAYSLAHELDKDFKLAASFFCSQQLPTCRDINLIFPTIAYQLARFSRPFRYALSRILEQNPDAHSRRVPEQFQKLIMEPFQGTKNVLPINLVIVIDALDECDSDEGLGEVLDTLLAQASDLPIKFIVTSRPEPIIRDRMLGRKGERVRFELHLHDLERSSVQEDIRRYLDLNLKSINIPANDLNILVERSGVLFIYAATVVRYIGADNFSRSNKRLKQVLSVSGPSSNPIHREIDALYSAILQAAFNDVGLEDSDMLEMTLILHTVLCARAPMTANTIAGLLELDSENSVRPALRPLLSVLYFSEKSKTIITLHESFVDYMFDERRSNQFYCNAKQHHALLAQRCFDLIKTPDPPFNLCALESPYLLDKDVRNLHERVEVAISMELFYACQYWGAHLVLAELPQTLSKPLDNFLSTRLLLWIEILNLKQSMHAGAETLYKVQSCSQITRCSEASRALISDTWAFITSFSSSPASYSTLHLYVSTLPFWPEYRPISKYYMPKICGLPKVVGSAMRRRDSAPLAAWNAGSAVISITFSPGKSHVVAGTVEATIPIWNAHTGRIVGYLEGHTDAVHTVAYSPDGAFIASGSADTSVRIWNSRTRRLVGQPLQGHSNTVCSVAYSPDGVRVVSGSGDKSIRIWDLRTGHMIGKPLEGHAGAVYSVVFSPDGAYIVSGSDDSSLRIWNAYSGQVLGNSIEGHTDLVSSVAYSRNGDRIVSGSWDRTLRIWDVQTHEMIGNPLEGHTASVCAVAYSPSDAYIVSGSQDSTIIIWDAQTGQRIGAPLVGHTGTIYSVAYSPDGARIVSCSDDHTVRVWSAQTSAEYYPVEGHTDFVQSVTYSPDGTRVASGSDDGSIRIWDAFTGKLLVGPIKCQYDGSAVYSIAYSPDGAYIASGSTDNVVYVWDARNGQTKTRLLNGHAASVYSVAYSPDGNYIASGSRDYTIRIWCSHSGQARGEPFTGHTGVVLSVVYSPGGDRVVSGSADGTVRIWDALTGQMVYAPLNGHSSMVLSVAYSPDGTRIASGSMDNTLRVWNAHSGQIIGGPLRGHRWTVSSVAFSPDGSRIISGSGDHSIRIWNTYTGQAICDPLLGHTDEIKSVACSNDGIHFASGSNDTSIRIWRLPVRPEGELAQTSTSGPQDVRHPENSFSSTFEIADSSGTLLSLSGCATNTSKNLDWILRKDGWVVVDNSKLLIWIPPEVRGVLLRPQNTAIISTHGSVRLELADEKFGTSWAECFI